MNEIELIKKWCERYGSKVVEEEFFKASWAKEGAVDPGGTIDVGSNEGIFVKDSYFFGHVDVSFGLSGTIVLTNQNSLEIQFISNMKGRQIDGNKFTIGIGSGLDLLGNGTYVGYTRKYAKGFNRLLVGLVGVGAATTTWIIELDGILFRMK